MKFLLEDLCSRAAVTVQLYTRVVAAVTKQHKITAVITESVSGREAFTAGLFIDCTGNGDLAAQAGNSFETGHPLSGKTQPATLMALISGFLPDSVSTLSEATKDAFLKAMQQAGFEPSYRKPSLFRLPNPLLSCIMINHEYDLPCDNAAELSQATMRARREINQALKALRSLADWENVRLVASASQIGIREGRRIHGLYQVKAADMIAGSKFSDGVCLVEYPVDIHALDRSEKSTYRAGIVAQPYHIPYRSLVAKDLTNLGLAGRCISGDFYAHASYRVTGNAVVLGEAAGIAAALAWQSKSSFHELAGDKVKHELVLAGHRL